MNISYNEFQHIDLRSGTIIRVEDFLRAKKPAYKIWVDFGGEIGIKQTSAQITQHYTKEILLGRQVIGCLNLGDKNIGGFVSQFLLLGCDDGNGGVSALTIDPRVPNGQKVF